MIYKILFLLFTLISSIQIQNRKNILYDNPIIFQIINNEPESETMSILSPLCMFNNKLKNFDCKKYLKIFVNMNCTFTQTYPIYNHNKNPNFIMYISPFTYNSYDSRLQIYNNTFYSWIQVAQGLLCQNNNICVFVIGFTLSYKNWNDVPIKGNNVTLNCSNFEVYGYL